MLQALTLAVLLANVPPAAAAPEISSTTRSGIEAAVSKFMADTKVPGLSAAVVEDGQFVWSQGFGQADVKKSIPATPATLFRLASVSKTITGVAAMQLWEQNKLDLDAPVQQYCPAFPKKEYPVTTRELLGHLGGIRHYKSDSPHDAEWGNKRHFDLPIRGGLSFFVHDPLIDKPGAKFHYSTQGFTLVGCAIEGASKQRFVDYVRDNVFKPAGMTNAAPDDPRKPNLLRTSYYTKDKNGDVVAAHYIDTSYKIPGGGFMANVEDMAHYEEALLADKLVKRPTRELMWTSQRTTAGEETGYGYGFDVKKSSDLVTVGHIGGQQGTSTDILIAPEKNAGVVVLMNMDGQDAAGLAKEILNIVLAGRTDAVH